VFIRSQAGAKKQGREGKDVVVQVRLAVDSFGGDYLGEQKSGSWMGGLG